MEINAKLSAHDNFHREFMGCEPSSEEYFTWVIAFTRAHVEAALQAAVSKAYMVDEVYRDTNKEVSKATWEVERCNSNGPDEIFVISENSILTAYPLENIK